MIEILKFFHPTIQVEILNRFEKTDEIDRIKSELTKQIETEFKPSNNVLSIIDLISRPNLQKDYDVNVKLVQETDFSNLLSYLSNQVGKKEDLELNLNNLIFILNKNRKSLNTYTVIFSLISIYHLQISLIYMQKENISKRCSIYSLLFKIYDEIKALDEYCDNISNNQIDVSDQNNYFMLKLSNESLVLKSYLINWYFIPLTIPCSSEFEFNNQLMYINQTLENTMNDSSFYPLLKYFEEISGYLFYFRFIIKKSEINTKILGLNTDFEGVREFAVEIYEEFDIDKLLELRKLCINFMKKDLILKDFTSEFEKNTSEIMMNQYIQLNCLLEMSTVNKIIINFPNNLEDYVEFLIKRQYPQCTIIRNKDLNTIEYEQKSYNYLEDVEFRLKPVKEIEETVRNLIKNANN